MKQIMEFLDNFSPFVSFGLIIISWIAGFAQHKISEAIKKRKITKILSLRKSDCLIELPIRYGKLTLDDNGMTMTNNMHYVTYEEARCLLEIPALLSKAGFKQTLKIKSEEVDFRNNRFIFGGPLANQYVYDFFGKINSDPNKNFHFGCSERTYNYNGEEKYQCLRKTVENGNKCLFYGKKPENNDENIFEYNKEYIVLIKQTGQDFGDEEHGTVHICFGPNACSSLNALRCLQKNTDVLYKKLKNHKSHYFVLFKCSDDGEGDFRKESFLDLTDIMFDDVKHNAKNYMVPNKI